MVNRSDVKVAVEEMVGNAPSYLLYGSGMLLLGAAFLLDRLHNATVWIGKKAINKAFPVGQKSEVTPRPEVTCLEGKERESEVSRARIDKDSEAIPKSSPESTIIGEQLSTDSPSTGEGTPLKTSAEVELTELKKELRLLEADCSNDDERINELEAEYKSLKLKAESKTDLYSEQESARH